METIHQFDYVRLKFDSDGRLQGSLQELRDAAARASDVIFIAHGFRNDENDATRWYTEFLRTLRGHIGSPEFQSKLGSRKFVVAGVYWPSKAFSENPGRDGGSVQGLNEDEQIRKLKAKLEDMKATEAKPEDRPKLDEAIKLLPKLEDSTEAQDRFVELVLSIVHPSAPDPAEGLEKIKSRAGSEVLESLAAPVILPTTEDDSEGGVAAVRPLEMDEEPEGMAMGFSSFFGNMFGRVGQLLNLTTWYVMKERAGTVGANGLASAVREIKKATPHLKVHLVGHSLGGRLMAACAKALSKPRAVQPNSMLLLQAAFSHYGFSRDNGHGSPGFFRGVIDSRGVKGPLVATFSAMDRVVGLAYAISSRLAGDNIKAVGDANDQYGGIGRNGAQRTNEAVFDRLHRVGSAYSNITPGKIVCLDGSENLITNHGDITNDKVTYAAASAIAQT